MDATHTLPHYEHSDVHTPIHPERRDEDVAYAEREPIDHIPARAIIIACTLGLGLWALIIGAGWWILH